MRGRRSTTLATVLALAVLGVSVTSTAQATVAKSQRNAVVFVSDLSSGFSGLEVNFYPGVEKATFLGCCGPDLRHAWTEQQRRLRRQHERADHDSS